MSSVHSRRAVNDGADAAAVPASGWVVAVAPLPASATCGEAYMLFAADPELPALAVVESDCPVGLLSRAALITALTERFTEPHAEGEPVTKIMDRTPPIVELSDDLERVALLAAESGREFLSAAAIVTENGRYRGLVTAQSLLSAMVARLTHCNENLARAHLAAAESKKSKTQFLAAVTHELRTPLNAIIGFAQIIAEARFGPEAIGRYQDYAEDILSSGQHLLEIINDILDVSKIDADKLVLREETVNVEMLVDTALHLVSPRASEGRVRLEAQIHERPCYVRGDKRLLRQLLLNLVANAVKFTLPNGRVLVRTETDAGGGLLLIVSDTGIGIAEEDIPKALTPFGQIDSRLGRRFDGTGLGLPLAKAMAEAHGGTLVLDSKVAIGTTVTVRLPADRVIAASAAQEKAG